jgi:hypothetical protein
MADNWFKWKHAAKEDFNSNIIGPKTDIIRNPLVIGNIAINCQFTARFTGVLKYRDFFNYPHLLEFCTLVKFPNIDIQSYPIGQPIRIQGTGCPTHNCADDECGPDWKSRELD